MNLTQIVLIIATGVLIVLIEIKPYLKSRKYIKKAKEEFHIK